MGGPGSRRARNWRHNRPNSPYKMFGLPTVHPPATGSNTLQHSYATDEQGPQLLGVLIAVFAAVLAWLWYISVPKK
jgi:hypothetical protein